MIRTPPLFTIIAALALVVLLSGAMLAQPTAPETPLVYVDGDIYVWNGSTVNPITGSGYAFDPVVSPDGEQLAFVEYSRITLEFLAEAGGFGGGALPTDLYLYDYASGRVTPLTQQPRGASLDDPDTETIARGVPVWSPDGSALAWSELIFTSTGIESFLVVYDDVDRTVTRIAALPQQYGIPTPLQLAWGEMGIVVWSATLNASDEIEDILLIFDTDGVQTASIQVLPRDDGSDFINNFLLVEWQGNEFIAVIFGSSEVVLYTPLELGSTIAPGVLQRYSLLNPGGVGLNLFPEGDFGSPFVAEIADGSGTILPVGYTFSGIALSPLADRYAYGTGEDGVVVTDGRGFETLIPAVGDGFVSAVVWGPTAWRINETFTPSSSEAADLLAGCDLTPRLEIGGEGFVLPGPANRLRTNPNTDSAIITNIPGEAFFFVTEGPVCAQGFVWWEVIYNEQVGWTAEGTDGQYYVAPAPAG